MQKLHEIKGITYIVDSSGKLFSTSNVGRGYYGKEITQRKNEDGYMVVTVGANNQGRSAERVHRIIAEAFIPNPLNLPEVDHIDNDRLNNDYTNLQWITGYDNKAKIPHEVRSASHSGTMNGRSMLTEDDVRNIRYQYENNNVKISELAKQYGRGYSTIFNIVKYLTWKDVI